jgi:hypothetical protein
MLIFKLKLLNIESLSAENKAVEKQRCNHMPKRTLQVKMKIAGFIFYISCVPGVPGIFLGVKVRPARKADNLAAIYEPIV